MIKSSSTIEHRIFDDAEEIMVCDHVINKIPYSESHSELCRDEIIQ